MTKFYVGQKVSYTIRRWRKRVPNTGIGFITRIALPLGNLPYTFIVDTFTAGVLFEDELEAL